MTYAALNLFDEEPTVHLSVMPQEVLAALAPRPGDVFADVTTGAGGQSSQAGATNEFYHSWTTSNTITAAGVMLAGTLLLAKQKS